MRRKHYILAAAVLAGIGGLRAAAAEAPPTQKTVTQEDAPARATRVSAAQTAAEKAQAATRQSTTPKARVLAPATPQRVATPQVENIDEKATHEQAQLIKVVNDKGEISQLHSFCVAKSGNVLASVGDGPGEIRMYQPDGKFLSAFPVPVKPEAINVDPLGDILVAGEGELFKYDPSGQLKAKHQSPHAANIQENGKQIREDLVKKNAQRGDAYKRQLELYDQRIAQIVKDGEEELSDPQKTQLAAYRRARQTMQKYLERYQPASDEQLDQMVKANLAAKMKVISISATSKDVFVACPTTVGYGFDVWRMDTDFSQGTKVVEGLRGCCSNMDVQANDNGLYVAENTRHRVGHYDRDGKMITAWGKKDRTGVDGFTSCCNPMNVCFGPGGDVFTSESTTGRIKRFSAKGEFLAYVGDVKLVPGCKKVSIGVSQDGDRVYMLDITRNHIILMKRKTADSVSGE